MVDRPIHIASLCAGIGGLDLGLHLALGGRCRTVVYVEREVFTAAILAARMQDAALAPAPIWSDLRTFDGRPWRGRVDVVTGGYPCQPFSFAGKRRGQDDPRHLWPSIARIVAEIQPGIVFFENVAGHLSLGFYDVRRELEGLGYRVTAGLFAAAEVGAPHRRERLFILGVADGAERERGDLRATSGGVGHLEQDGGDVDDAERAGSGQGKQGKQGKTRLRRGGPANAGGPVRPCAGCGYEFDHDLLGKYGCPNCEGSGLADAGCERPQGQRGDGPAAGATGRGDGALDDPTSTRHIATGSGSGAMLEGRQCVLSDGRAELPVFPPGPGAVEQWRRILAVQPDLAPAVEPRVRGVADGTPAGLDGLRAGRLDRLRALGNGVVPACAARAFVTLWACLQEHHPMTAPTPSRRRRET